jgi:hypothetical protein
MTIFQIAYEQKGSIKSDAKRKKLPKELSKAMIHARLSLNKARSYYQEMTKTNLVDSSVRGLAEDYFRQFLSALAFFLKAESEEGREMKRFTQDSEPEKLSRKDLARKAMELSDMLREAGEANVNKNKLKRLGARLSASRDPYEALAHLARFYPLKGVPEEVIDHLVEKLEKLELESFKNLYALGLRFYEAKLEGWEG